MTSKVMNIAGSTCKRLDILKAKQHKKVKEALVRGDIVSGQGLNQETNLQRPGDTRWGSHLRSLVRRILRYGPVLKVLEDIMEDGLQGDKQVDACTLLNALQSFEFVFTLHLMKSVLGITNELSLALQRKEQEIENAMRLVQISKQRLQTFRDSGWQISLLDEVSSFCATHEIVVPDMNGIHVPLGRVQRKRRENKTNFTHFRIELFYVVLDKQLMKLNSRFSVTTTELLHFVGCLNPKDSFSAFNKENIISRARLYPREFSKYDLYMIGNQLETYILDVRSTSEVLDLEGIADLVTKMVETKKHNIYHLVYMLVTLELTLPVSTASVEITFSAMKIVKTQPRNRMSDDWLNACLVTYIEKDVFDGVKNEAIMQRYQTMSPCREEL